VVIVDKNSQVCFHNAIIVVQLTKANRAWSHARVLG
jgi:hypothetical protein